MKDFRQHRIDAKEWGSIKIMRPIIHEGEDPWGKLAVLKETSLEGLIPVVSGDAFSHALHGFVKPLLDEIGPEPKSLLRMISKDLRPCASSKACIMHDKIACVMGHPKVPDCFTPSGFEGAAVTDVAAKVLLAWSEGRYVVVVSGAEFSL